MRSSAGTDEWIDENIELLNMAELPGIAVTEGAERITILREVEQANAPEVTRNVVIEKSFANPGSVARCV